MLLIIIGDTIPTISLAADLQHFNVYVLLKQGSRDTYFFLHNICT